MDLGRVGIWTDQFDSQPIQAVRDAATLIEDLGYGALWVPEAVGREAMAQAALLLSATRRMVVANGVASVYARDAVTAAAGYRTLAEAFPERVLLGLGISHPSLVQDVRGHRFGPPVATMRAYLDALAAAPFGPAVTTPGPVLGALGPRMLALAAERAAGALPLGMPVRHTKQAREILGPDGLLAVAQVVVADRDRAEAVVPDLLPNRRALLDLADDQLVDALVVYGGPERVAERVRQHTDAGADHVALHVIGDGLPTQEWRDLAAVLLSQ
jgi:probable F420-dependent oxidoreductase